MGHFYLLLIVLFFVECKGKENKEMVRDGVETTVKTGADAFSQYLPLLEAKNVAVVTNQSGVVRIYNDKDSVEREIHLVDFLLEKKIKVKVIFAPEHGFRGDKDAGAVIENSKDKITGLPIFSLHGKNKKPQLQQLYGIDYLVFDIQDVGVRFYTYISTLHYVLEACAENRVSVVVLDRPNPNGHYVDGPVLEDRYRSFLGMHQVPIVYGMTIGEYARMIVGEKWLNTSLFCDLTVVKLENWTHKTRYVLPKKPSPNLPNAQAINLYPSLCFFEQTPISVGRGTSFPFQVYGSPLLDTTKYSFRFFPRARFGATNPKHKEHWCYGEDLRNAPIRLDKIELKWLIAAYNDSDIKEIFFQKHFEYLAGTRTLREQIQNGWSVEQIRKSWESKILKFKKIRKKYLLYPDFQ